MTDDPYASPIRGATLPPDVTRETPELPARPFALPTDFPVPPTDVAPAQPADVAPADVAPADAAPADAGPAVVAPGDAAPVPGAPTGPGGDAPGPNHLTPEQIALISTDAPPDAKLVSLDVPIEIVDAGDGRKAELIGDVDRLKGFVSQQGDNPYGYAGDCGLVSCRNIFKQFGLDATEQSVVAYAIGHGLCDAGKPGDPPEQLGGTTPLDQARILTDNGVPAHVSQCRTADDLAAFVQTGRGVIIGVNAGLLWNDPNTLGNGEPNHAITVIGVVRDPSTQALQGFIVNDSGNGKTEVVSAAMMDACFVQKGGVCVTTDHAAPRAQ